MIEIEKEIKEKAIGVGFDLVGITDVKIEKNVVNFYNAWIKRGFHDSKKYLEKPTRFSPKEFLKHAKSIIMVGLNYLPYDFDNLQKENSKPQIALYAQVSDYHIIVKRKLSNLSSYIQEKFNAKTKLFVDTSPILERYFCCKGWSWFYW